ncbi:SAF domain-containing protein [Phycicoccus endophyticus]|uniref:SAF domain-containing protein n=1 Tax=Phycicoccus endophyticus TaxID=1690220 RepID=UPI00166879AD|nr:SAF domain-containing protein [Phycicoccus endophyticus]GGL34584.1 hypothetical protein GCM10012283_16310 [Phycicoccus endophyticus]
MAPLPRPVPGLTGPGRRARWRRVVARRLLAAACLGGAVLAGLHTLRPPEPPMVEVVVAARAVPAGSVLTAGDLAVRSVPSTARQPAALARPRPALGRRLDAALAPGEALTRARLVPRTPAEGLPAGHVALHVTLADPAAAEVLAPGQPVAVYPATGGAALARDGVVLAVDPPADEVALALTGGGSAARGVVLELPDGSAERVLAGHGGLDGSVSVSVTARGG